jgi:hypothetical protein
MLISDEGIDNTSLRPNAENGCLKYVGNQHDQRGTCTGLDYSQSEYSRSFISQRSLKHEAF